MNSIKEYLQDRLRTLLRPSFDRIVYPWTLFGKLTPKQWSYFLLGFFAWAWDAFDFHSVTISYPDLIGKKGFDKTLEQLTLAVTFTLMTRPIGGAIFGILSDRYGRKWPFIANCVLLMVFVLATALCKKYEQFIAVRALFGCAMGGIYGNAAATALEDCPEESRGLMSGIYQSGYPLGYVLAVVFYKAFSKTPDHWRTLFWFGSAVPVLLIIYRLCLDETDAWEERKRFRSQQANIKSVGIEVKIAIKRHWLLLIYLVFLVMGMMYLSHGTQDIYPYLLKEKYRHLVAPDGATDAVTSKVTTIQTTASLGGVIGGMVTGYSSQILGRRLAIIIVCLIGGALLYPYTFTTGGGIYAAAFFEQFCVQGGWSVIPIHLIELSPPAFRTLVVGTSYQTASLLAAASNTILVRIASRFPIGSEKDASGKQRNDFRIPIAAFAGCAFAYVIMIAAIGPERRGRDMVEDDDSDDSDESDTEFGIRGTARDMAQARC